MVIILPEFCDTNKIDDISPSLVHTYPSSPQPEYSRIPIFNLLIYHLSTMKIVFKNLFVVRED